VLSDWKLAHAFDDLIHAISVPHVSSVNCARAIEGLKHLLSTDAMNDKQRWEHMRNVLNLSKDYLSLITKSSEENRHGKRSRVEGDVASDVTRRSWTIMNRYLEFRKRGSADPLPADQFPLL